MCFEGGTLRVNKGLNSHFQVSHTLNLPTNPQSPSGYKFGATYVGTKMLSPTEVITSFFDFFVLLKNELRIAVGRFPEALGTLKKKLIPPLYPSLCYIWG